MNLRHITLSLVLTGVFGAAAMAQAPQEQLIDPKTSPSAVDSARAEAYYNFTMGHIYEQQYEATSSAEYATKAIEAYKNAYALDPKSQVIGERLAEMYWKAQRIHHAVTEAQEILKRDPANVQSRHLPPHRCCWIFWEMPTPRRMNWRRRKRPIARPLNSILRS